MFGANSKRPKIKPLVHRDGKKSNHSIFSTVIYLLLRVARFTGDRRPAVHHGDHGGRRLLLVGHLLGASLHVRRGRLGRRRHGTLLHMLLLLLTKPAKENTSLRYMKVIVPL